jgi:hypothetical protein
LVEEQIAAIETFEARPEDWLPEGRDGSTIRGDGLAVRQQR